MARHSYPSSICRCVMKPQLQAAALLFSLFMCGPTQAEIYKWTDKQGVRHYSEQPPADIKYEKVTPRYAPPVNSPAAQPLSESQNGQTKAAEQQQQQEKAENAKIRQQNCETVQKRLAEFQSSPRISIKNPDGTVQRLSEDERQTKITEAQELIKQYCN